MFCKKRFISAIVVVGIGAVLGVSPAQEAGEGSPAGRAPQPYVQSVDATGRGVLAAAYANRGIVHDRQGEYAKALEDYIGALKVDEGAVEGPGVIHKILYGSDRVSTVRDRARYLHEQLQKPEAERVMRIPELDARQRMHKP